MVEQWLARLHSYWKHSYRLWYRVYYRTGIQIAVYRCKCGRMKDLVER